MKLMRGVMKMPIHWRLWVMLVATLNLIGPLFFMNRTEAQVVFVVMLLTATLMMLLTAKLGFTRILEAGHVLWIPLVIFLWTKLAENPAGQPFGLWLRAVIAANGLALIIDLIDVLRYAAGDREETVKGL